MAGSCASTPRRRCGCRASSRCGPAPTSPTFPPIDFRDASRAADEIKPYRQPVLAIGRVRYVGDPVAAVFAEDPYVAEDAADLVEVEIEPLPALLSASDPPGEFDDGRNTAPLDRAPQLRRHRRGVRRGSCGDRARSLRSAAIRACRWRPAAPSASTTPPMTCWSCTAPPRCRTGTRTRWCACSGSRRRRSISTRATPAAASACAASSIRKTCWCCSRRSASAVR